MNPFKHSIKYLKERLINNPKLYQTRETCLHLIHVSQLVRSTTEPNEAYINNFYKCLKLKKKISKRQCMNCKMFNPLDNNKRNGN